MTTLLAFCGFWVLIGSGCFLQRFARFARFEVSGFCRQHPDGTGERGQDGALPPAPRLGLTMLAPES